LFKAYEYVPDQQFNQYIEGIRDRYNADIEDRTADELMILAVNKYDLLEQRKAIHWIMLTRLLHYRQHQQSPLLRIKVLEDVGVATVAEKTPGRRYLL
jgi:hypothetical protein